MYLIFERLQPRERLRKLFKLLLQMMDALDQIGKVSFVFLKESLKS